MKCTRCDGTGFLNLEQLPSDFYGKGFEGDRERVLAWMDTSEYDNDVQVCDCCGDGDAWHGIPGEHYSPDDRAGQDGPYAGNGGYAHCH